MIAVTNFINMWNLHITKMMVNFPILSLYSNVLQRMHLLAPKWCKFKTNNIQVCTLQPKVMLNMKSSQVYGWGKLQGCGRRSKDVVSLPTKMEMNMISNGFPTLTVKNTQHSLVHAYSMFSMHDTWHPMFPITSIPLKTWNRAVGSTATVSHAGSLIPNFEH